VVVEQIMGRGIAAAAELKPVPKIVIVLTDGYTPWPAEPPAKVGVSDYLFNSSP